MSNLKKVPSIRSNRTESLQRIDDDEIQSNWSINKEPLEENYSFIKHLGQ